MDIKYFAVFLVFAAMFLVGCSSNPSDTTDDFKKESLEEYEKLIAKTDGNVVAALGEGEEKKIDDVLFQRKYQGNFMNSTGDVTVKYYVPEEEELLSKTFDTSLRQVSVIVLTSMETRERAIEIKENLEAILGDPAAESGEFTETQYYLSTFEGERCHYIFQHYPSFDGEGNSGIVFGFLDKPLLPDPYNENIGKTVYE